MGVDGELLTLRPLWALLVEPHTVRRLLNDTDAGALRLVAGTPLEGVSTRELTPELLAELCPDGPRVPPPERDGGARAPRNAGG